MPAALAHLVADSMDAHARMLRRESDDASRGLPEHVQLTDLLLEGLRDGLGTSDNGLAGGGVPAMIG